MEALSYQFHGSRIGLLSGFGGTPKVITAVTAANPPVVTSAAHGLADGAVGRIAAVLGMTELNGRTVVIEVLSANTFSLLGVRAAEFAAYVSGGTFEVGEFTEFCALTNYQRQGDSADEQETTTLCTEDYKTYKVGLADPGTTQVDYLFAPVTDTLQVRMSALAGSREISAFQIELPEAGGVMTQLCWLQQTSESAGNGELWKGSATFRNSGKRYDFEAVAA